MNPFPHILADGLPPGMIFAIAIFILIAVANVMANKLKTNQPPKDSSRAGRGQPNSTQRGGRHGEPGILEMILEPQRRASERSQQEKRREEQRREKAKKISPARLAPTPPPRPVVKAAPATELVSASSGRRSSASARNVRLLLQPTGIRDAILLGEVLGKPKSLKDE